MSQYLTVLALAAIPADGNFLGGLLAEVVPISPRGLSLALHAAAGIVLSVVAVELLLRALKVAPPWATALAFIGGGLFFMALDAAVDLVRRRFRGGDDSAAGGPWLIYLGVAVDLLSDGIMIGAGAAVTHNLGLLLALGQVAADAPEGFATIAVLRRRGIARRTRLRLSASFIIPVLIGATIGYLGVHEASETVKLLVLVLTAGVLTTMTVEEMMPAAHEEHEGRLATLCFIEGFAMFIVVAGFLEPG